MSVIFFASAMGVLAYFIIWPILLVFLIVGLILSETRSWWANIPGGVFLLYAWMELWGFSRDGSERDIAIFIKVATVAAILIACVFAWRCPEKTPDWLGSRPMTQDMRRLLSKLLSIFAAFSLQLATAIVIALPFYFLWWRRP